jgi:hypothetical protein
MGLFSSPPKLRIFVCYRRKTWGFTHRLIEHLNGLIDAEIFVDFSGINESNFERSILRNLEQSHVVIVVITEHTFAPELIHREKDWVRHEIAYALEKGKPIVLACDNGLIPPAPEDLPENIRAITKMQGIQIHPGQKIYEACVQELADFIATIAPVEVRHVPIENQIYPHNAKRDKAIRFLDSGNYDEAIRLFTELRDAGYQSRFFDADAALQEAIERRDARKRYRQATRDYADIDAWSRISPDRARLAWAEFLRDYPDFTDDPANLAERLKVPFTLPMLEWVPIPAGEVVIEGQVYTVKAFQMSKYLVTNAQFQVFTDSSDGYTNMKWWGYSPQASEWREHNSEPQASGFKGDKRPREQVTWYEAVAFCRWLSTETGLPVSLPTEMQWQHAAQGDDGREYPWGNGFDKSRCNTSESDIRQTTDVDHYRNGISQHGVYDLGGNVGEWCLNEYDNPSGIDIGGHVRRAVRGGSWYSLQVDARSSCRYGYAPTFLSYFLGFRLALSAPGK